MKGAWCCCRMKFVHYGELCARGVIVGVACAASGFASPAGDYSLIFSALRARRFAVRRSLDAYAACGFASPAWGAFFDFFLPCGHVVSPSGKVGTPARRAVSPARRGLFLDCFLPAGT